MDNIQLAQQKYISEWHDNFVNYIRGLISLVVAIESNPSATDEDNQEDVLDKKEKLDKNLVDMAIEHLSTDAVVKEFLKRLSYYQIEQNKHLAEVRLKDLQILK